MTTLEDALRAALRDEAAVLPPTTDHASRAIARAAVIRRWRTAGAMLVTVLLTALGISGFLRVHLGPAPSNHAADGAPSPFVLSARFPTGTGFDIFNGYTILTNDGDQLSLDPPRLPLDVQRVPAGWLYRTQGGAVWLRAGKGAVGLGIQGSTMVVSPDGTRVATADDTAHTIAITPVSGAAGGARSTTGVPAGTDVVAITGGVVVLRQTGSCCGGGARFDVWDPSKGAYRPTWLDGVETIYGVGADGLLVAAVRQTAQSQLLCLATLSIAASGHLAIGAKICDDTLSLRAEGAVSPDGRLLVTGAWNGYSPNGAVLIDLDAPTDRSRRATCPTGASPPVWGEDGVALLRDGNKVNRCTLTGWDMIQPGNDEAATLIGWNLVGFHG